MIRTLRSGEETKGFAKEMIDAGFTKNVVLLFGDLGAGKTTFTQGLAEALGIKEQVTSPTFVISKVYKVPLGKFDQLAHFDLYRLKSIKEVWELGLKEYLEDSKTLTVIEWPELVDKEIADEKKLSVRFSHGEGDTRFIEFK